MDQLQNPARVVLKASKVDAGSLCASRGEAKRSTACCLGRRAPAWSFEEKALCVLQCRIRGSEGVERLGLDRRFAMFMVTELTWQQPPAGSSEVSASRRMRCRLAVCAHGESRTIESGAVTTLQGSITGSSKLDVWCEVVAPFHLMPRPFLEGTCNGILQATITTLLPLFLQILGRDFEKWATDPVYRRVEEGRLFRSPWADRISSTRPRQGLEGSAGAAGARTHGPAAAVVDRPMCNVLRLLSWPLCHMVTIRR